MEQPNKVNPVIAALIVIVLVGGATAAVALMNDGRDTESEIRLSPRSNQTTQSNRTPATASYKDGEYVSEGSYVTPGGRESIGLTVALKNGIVEDAHLEQRASGGDTVVYQRKFASGYKAEVVGKSIDEIRLSRVAGSSLTSNGFNDALEQIKTDASL